MHLSPRRHKLHHSTAPLRHASITPARDQFLRLTKQGNLIPLAIDLVADVETPVSAFAKLQNVGPCFLFESAEKNDELGRFSFIGTDPLLIFQSRASEISITKNGQTRTFETKSDPLSELETVMAGFNSVTPPNLPHFVGGAVGFIGYEAVQLFEKTVPLHPRDDLRLPEMIFMIARTM